MESIKDDFKRALLEAVDEGLLLIGEGSRHVIYYHVERSHHVKREEIPEKLEAFHKGLQALLGTGAKVPEKLIAKKLYNKLGLSFIDRKNWTPVDYIKHAKRTENLARSSAFCQRIPSNLFLALEHASDSIHISHTNRMKPSRGNGPRKTVRDIGNRRKYLVFSQLVPLHCFAER